MYVKENLPSNYMKSGRLKEKESFAVVWAVCAQESLQNVRTPEPQHEGEYHCTEVRDL